MNTEPAKPTPTPPISSHPFRRAVVRGLAGFCPPLLTVLIFVWAINTTKSYFLEPVTAWAREALVWRLADVRENLPLKSEKSREAVADDQLYHQLDNGTFIPEYGLRAGAEAAGRAAAGHRRRLLSAATSI